MQVTYNELKPNDIFVLYDINNNNKAMLGYIMSSGLTIQLACHDTITGEITWHIEPFHYLNRSGFKIVWKGNMDNMFPMLYRTIIDLYQIESTGAENE